MVLSKHSIPKGLEEEDYAVRRARWRRLIRDDARAKEEGTLVGRYYMRKRPEGYLYYVVYHLNKDGLRAHVGPAWDMPTMGTKTIARELIPIVEIENNIARREALHACARRETGAVAEW